MCVDCKIPDKLYNSAQECLHEIVYVEILKEDREVTQFQQMDVVELIKSISDIFSPVNGETTVQNLAIVRRCLMKTLMEKGWPVKIILTNF